MFGFLGGRTFPDSWYLENTPADIVIYGPQAWGWMGWSVALGDVDGDGYEDLITGAPNMNSPGRVSEAYIVRGGPLPPQVIDLAVTPPDVEFIGVNDIWSQVSALGSAVAAGDIDGDGIDDVAFGAHHYNVPDTGSGQVYVFLGGALWNSIYDLNTEIPDIRVTGGAFREGQGSALELGDLNGDGSRDVISAGHGYTYDSSREFCGRVIMVAGPDLGGWISCRSYDDLFRKIDEASIDVQGVRNSLRSKAENSNGRYLAGDLRAAGNILCALLHEIDAQDGKHVESSSAKTLRACIKDMAQVLGIELPCVRSDEDEDSDESGDCSDILYLEKSGDSLFATIAPTGKSGMVTASIDPRFEGKSIYEGTFPALVEPGEEKMLFFKFVEK